MLLVMLGISEFGRAFYQYSTVVKAARDGARYASKESLNASNVVDLNQIRPFHPTSVANETRNLVVYGNTSGTGSAVLEGFQTSDVSVTAPDPNHVELSVAYQYIPMIGNTLPSFGISTAINLNFSMSTTVRMRAH
ncbi:MAG: pilus assembly protein [Gammaproteobacteria bacterium]|nr:pilus assembly protein [Gammaproteobacteria bacterium]